jgi:hypothetical protein
MEKRERRVRKMTSREKGRRKRIYSETAIEG